MRRFNTHISNLPGWCFHECEFCEGLVWINHGAGIGGTDKYAYTGEYEDDTGQWIFRGQFSEWDDEISSGEEENRPGANHRRVNNIMFLDG